MTKPTDDNINWDPNLSFDPTNVADPFATHGIPIPTYGNYGGPGYTAGTLGGTTPPLDPQTQLPDPPWADDLDRLFYLHDFAIQEAHGDLPTIVLATVQLVLGMDTLAIINPNDPAHYDPAAQLYEGLATLAVVSQIIAPAQAWQFIGSLPGGQTIQGDIIAATQHAVVNFEEGLAALPGEAGSLHGALQVFEHKFADTLPFDIM
jgi:hypothetical protein